MGEVETRSSAGGPRFAIPGALLVSLVGLAGIWFAAS
jgi:hypothetical protein